MLPGATFGVLAVAQAVLLLTGAPTGPVLALTFGMTIVGGSLLARSMVLRREQESLYGRVRERERELQVLNERLGEESRRDPLTGLGNRLRLAEDIVGDRRARGPLRARLLPRALRPRPLQGLQRPDGPPGRRRRAAPGRRACSSATPAPATASTATAARSCCSCCPSRTRRPAAPPPSTTAPRCSTRRSPHPMNTPDVVTFSAGVAAAGLFETPEDVLRRADQALYEAKANGRNRVCIADPVAI